MTRALVAFGANLGDPTATFVEVRDRLGELPGVEAVVASSLYETIPVGGPSGQPAFLNGAFAVDTSLDVETFFARMRHIEFALGRERKEAWGPRTVDLDLALFGDAIHSSASLATPHPRMHFRRFVLAPVAEITPDAVHPVLRMTLAELHRSAVGLTKGEQLLALVGGDPDERSQAKALLTATYSNANCVALPASAFPATPLVQAGALVGARPAVHLPGVEDRGMEQDLDRVWEAMRARRLWVAAMTPPQPGPHPVGDVIAPAVDLSGSTHEVRRTELMHLLESLAEPTPRRRGFRATFGDET